MRDDTHESDAEQRWLLLIHQIPPKPDYLRVKIGRRLQRVGAVPVKNSVYVLPDGAQPLEDFQWIRTEIVAGGGDATICRADFVEGLTSGEARDLFRQARSGEFTEIAQAATRQLKALDSTRANAGRASRGRGATGDDARGAADELARLRKRFAVVAGLDYFHAPERLAAEDALNALEARLRPTSSARTSEALAAAGGAEYRGRTWVTREGVFIDRIASAWLIRRFIDPEARFAFVPGQDYRPTPGELRFDMVDGEFTHVSDRCTFEVLVYHFGLESDKALVAIAASVHDLDLKDEMFGREETAGVGFVLTGIATAHADDATRVERGSAVFDDLYAHLSKDKPTAATAD